MGNTFKENVRKFIKNIDITQSTILTSCKKHLYYILLLIAIFLFHAKLFLPNPTIYVTPDFGRSDALHSNIPAKYLLSQSLKSFELPTWSNQIGQGFPVLAEGIAGTFFIPNLIIFGFLPFKLAIPFMYLSTSIITATSMYLLLNKKFRLPPFSATIGAFSYTFCASIVLHTQHFNFLQAASLIPLYIYLLLGMHQKITLRNSLLQILVLSQVFFAGFVQIYVYLIFVSMSIVFVHSYLADKHLMLKKLFVLLVISIFSLLISAAQVLPSVELNSRSSRAEGLGAAYILKNFPYNPQMLATFLDPFIRGSAQNGTYNSTNWNSKGIFWENSAYIGISSLLLALVSIFFILRSKPRQEKIYLTLLIVALLTILLSFGKNSPTQFVFSIPPLNMFRVPSRFLLFTQLLLSIMAAHGASKLVSNMPKKIRQFIPLLLLSILILDIYIHWFNYNPSGKAADWLKDPQFAQTIKKLDKEGTSRVITLNSFDQWNQVFTTHGWENKINEYYFFRNALDPNINVLFGLNQFGVFETIPTRRYNIINSALRSNIEQKDHELYLSDKAEEILEIYNVKFIISTKNLHSTNFKLVSEISSNGFLFKLYKSDSPNSLGRFYNKVHTAKNITDLTDAMITNNIRETLVLEEEVSLEGDNSQNGKVIQVKNTATELTFETSTSAKNIFSVPITYYPGWEFEIEGKKFKPLVANINSQAVIVPKGEHTIKLKYKPTNLRVGILITLVSYVTLIILLIRKPRRVEFTKI